MKRPLVIHPFLFALFPILFVFSQNQEHLSLAQVWLPSLFLLGIALTIFLLFALILRDARRAGILLSLFLLLFFSYGQVVRLVQLEPLVLLALWAAILLGGAAFAVMLRQGLDEITKIINVVASVLVLISLFNIGSYELRRRAAQHGESDFEPLQVVSEGTLQADALPDIYYIILDGYARADVLQELYGYDNSEFLAFLDQMGFFVADNSRANYAHTALSLASSLNLGYLDDDAARIGLETEDREPLGDMIENSAVIQFLKQQGYVIVTFPTGYSPTELESADIQLGRRRSLNDLETGLLLSTPIPWLVVRGSEFNPQAPHGQRILYTLDHLVDAAELPSPHFVFAHVLGPHAPFVFDEHGNEVKSERPFNLGDGSHFFERGGTRDEYLYGYTGQLAFINTRVKGILEDLLARSSRPAVIILQADHGPGLLLDWDNPENTYFKERLSIFNAYLLPGDGSAGLYDGITPVNTFRLIFNRYFGTDLEQLEDRSYFSTWEKPYKFIDVTADVR